ncbi:hypothetical protein NIES4074_46380 [Cylindrospermum sp. NIES-4074]|nr:hypothetical protein NIES4074_46380 [Cylindrospermum sp. NIES-4074]
MLKIVKCDRLRRGVAHRIPTHRKRSKAPHNLAIRGFVGTEGFAGVVVETLKYANLLSYYFYTLLV